MSNTNLNTDLKTLPHALQDWSNNVKKDRSLICCLHWDYQFSIIDTEEAETLFIFLAERALKLKNYLHKIYLDDELTPDDESLVQSTANALQNSERIYSMLNLLCVNNHFTKLQAVNIHSVLCLIEDELRQLFTQLIELGQEYKRISCQIKAAGVNYE